MTTCRRYTFQSHGPHPTERLSRVEKALTMACRWHHWFTEPEVAFTPEPWSLTITFTVAGRDRWWVHERAKRLAVDCFYAFGLTEAAVPTPTWVVLTPHANRGRYRRPRGQQ